MTSLIEGPVKKVAPYIIAFQYMMEFALIVILGLLFLAFGLRNKQSMDLLNSIGAAALYPFKAFSQGGANFLISFFTGLWNFLSNGVKNGVKTVQNVGGGVWHWVTHLSIISYKLRLMIWRMTT